MILKIGHLNVRSLTSSFQEFKDVLLEGRYDVLGLTETFIDPNFDTRLVAIDSYNFFSYCSANEGWGCRCLS